MKKLFFVLLAFVIVYGCQKKEMEMAPQTVDVVFAVEDIDPDNGLKSPGDWECPTDDDGNLIEPVMAYIEITDGVNTYYFQPDVFRLDGKLYTQAIKLEALDGAVKTYTVNNFLLQDAGGNTIMATPAVGGEYSEYTTIEVPFPFDVNAFEKAEVPVEVLCYFPETHDFFGFTWFNITEIVLREFCFFGDICLNGDPYVPADFEGPEYGTGLGVDIPAIMQIVVKKDGVPVPNNDLFTNEDYQGIGEPLCVQYPDRLNVTGEEFTFELWILVPDCDGVLDYRLFHTFTTIDDAPLPDVDNDGVTDFVVGSCNLSTTDLQLQHFTWLIVQDFFDAPNGWVVTDDPTAGPIYRWSPKGAGTTGYANIAPPIAHFLNKAGYADPALLGFESIYYDTPLISGGVGSASIYGLLQAYLTTSDSKFETAAQTAWPLYEIKYPSDGSGNATYYSGNYPREPYWAYDYFQSLFSAQMAAAQGYTGAATYLTAATARFQDMVAGNITGFVLDDYQKIFVNAIAIELGIGVHQGTVTWVPWDGTTGYEIQEAAYGLMGNSWENPDVVKAYILENICDYDYSEPVAEAAYALGL